MSKKNINGSSLVSDGEQLLDSPQKSSPTLRAAAYHPDLELAGTQPRAYRNNEAFPSQVSDGAENGSEVERPESALNIEQTENGVSLDGNKTSVNEEPRTEWVPLSEVEGRYVAQVLAHTRGNKQAAARLLAIDRKTLDRMIKRHHIDLEQARRARR